MIVCDAADVGVDCMIGGGIGCVIASRGGIDGIDDGICSGCDGIEGGIPGGVKVTDGIDGGIGGGIASGMAGGIEGAIDGGIDGGIDDTARPGMVGGIQTWRMVAGEMSGRLLHANRGGFVVEVGPGSPERGTHMRTRTCCAQP